MLGGGQGKEVRDSMMEAGVRGVNPCKHKQQGAGSSHNARAYVGRNVRPGVVKVAEDRALDPHPSFAAWEWEGGRGGPSSYRRGVGAAAGATTTGGGAPPLGVAHDVMTAAGRPQMAGAPSQQQQQRQQRQRQDAQPLAVARAASGEAHAASGQQQRQQRTQPPQEQRAGQAASRRSGGWDSMVRSSRHRAQLGRKASGGLASGRLSGGCTGEGCTRASYCVCRGVCVWGGGA